MGGVTNFQTALISTVAVAVAWFILLMVLSANLGVFGPRVPVSVCTGYTYNSGTQTCTSYASGWEPTASCLIYDSGGKCPPAFATSVPGLMGGAMVGSIVAQALYLLMCWLNRKAGLVLRVHHGPGVDAPKERRGCSCCGCCTCMGCCGCGYVCALVGSLLPSVEGSLSLPGLDASVFVITFRPLTMDVEAAFRSIASVIALAKDTPNGAVQPATLLRRADVLARVPSQAQKGMGATQQQQQHIIVTVVAPVVQYGMPTPTAPPPSVYMTSAPPMMIAPNGDPSAVIAGFESGRSDVPSESGYHDVYPESESRTAYDATGHGDMLPGAADSHAGAVDAGHSEEAYAGDAGHSEEAYAVEAGQSEEAYAVEAGHSEEACAREGKGL